MTVTVTHTKVSAIPDGTDTTVVRPSDWNATHTLVGLGTAAELNAGVANGVATLDSSGKVPLSQLSGVVTSVTGTAPVVSSGGTTPAISMAAATAAVNGYLTSTDWSTFNNKQAAGAYLTAVTADAPLTGAGTSASHLSIPAATSLVNGYLTSADWTTFNNKGSGTVTSVSGTAPVVSSGGATPAISMAAATTSVNGYLTSIDWTTFNGKQAALVSGTNIKTVNSTSLLGSGNVSVGVTSVTGTAPVVSSGGDTPAISMAAANTTTNGYLTSTDWNTFNGKGAGTVTSVAASVPSFLSVAGSPVTSSGTLAISYSGTALPVANGGTGSTTATGTGSVVLATSPTVTGLTFTSAASAAPAFSAYNNSGTTMSNGAYVKVTFDSEYFDTNSNFASSRFTPTVAGYYQINTNFVYLGTAVTQTVCGLYKNGALFTYSNHFGTTANTASSINLSTIVYANGTTDYFEIYCYMTGTGTLSVQNGQQSYFNAAMIRSA
jgi:hypothetical protein